MTHAQPVDCLRNNRRLAGSRELPGGSRAPGRKSRRRDHCRRWRRQRPSREIHHRSRPRGLDPEARGLGVRAPRFVSSWPRARTSSPPPKTTASSIPTGVSGSWPRMPSIPEAVAIAGAVTNGSTGDAFGLGQLSSHLRRVHASTRSRPARAVPGQRQHQLQAVGLSRGPHGAGLDGARPERPVSSASASSPSTTGSGLPTSRATASSVPWPRISTTAARRLGSSRIPLTPAAVALAGLPDARCACSATSPSSNRRSAPASP